MRFRLSLKDSQEEDGEEPKRAAGAKLPALGAGKRAALSRGSTEATKVEGSGSQIEPGALPLPVQNQNAVKGSVTVRRPTRFGVHWARFLRRLGTGTAPSTSSLRKDGTATDSGVPGKSRVALAEATDELDEVVVDRVWSEDIKTSVTHSVYGNTNEKSGSFPNYQQTTDDNTSVSSNDTWTRWPILAFLRWRMWPMIAEIFSSKFDNEDSEKHYAQENWFIKKSLAMWAAVWLILNWVLGVIFARPIYQTFDLIYYYAWAPSLSFPVVFMVIYDWPRDRPMAYQIFLVISVWSWAFYNVIFLYSCPYYTNSPHDYFNCQQRDFIGLLYYATGLQTIALFGLKLDRLPAAIGAGCFFIITSALMIPIRKTWARSMLNQLFFHSFLIYVHYMRENSERRLFTLRDQLKIQYKATQKAQVNERKAADSKRRLTSYVFHEVRVPLNTALLAVQNMGASCAVAKEHEVEFTALEGSLSMMSKVLNDVLDFNRMDSGKFESAAQPYGFHQVMRSLFIPLQLVTDARGLQFCTRLDPRIDQIARRAAYEAMGETPEAIAKHLENYPEVDGVVVGDESRLRQIITNLASNACKFTPEGGKLSITTSLLYPALPSIDGLDDDMLSVSSKEAVDSNSVKDDCDASTRPQLNDRRPSLTKGTRPPLSRKYLQDHNEAQPRPPVEKIVVRIEISDTGYGIRPADMTQNKLFSAFNQTEQGRQQGGKGTGLGLALVRQIVKLSGGRLGVRSKVGHGSTFWVELPLTVGRQTLQHGMSQLTPGVTPGNGSDGRDLSAPPDLSGDALKNLSNGDSAHGKGSSVGDVTPHANSNVAMQTLMEQAGRVELVLQRFESDSAAPLSRSIVDSLGSSHVLSKAESGSVAASRSSSPDVSKQVDKPTHLPLPERTPRTALTASSSGVTDSSPGSNADSVSLHTSSPSGAPDGIKRANKGRQSLNIEPNLPVLVVDDDPLTRTLMKRLLTRLGCQVETAENGEIALEMILGPQELVTTPSLEGANDPTPILEREGKTAKATSEPKYAVVFLDNQMPVMSGLGAVAKLRELGRSDFVVGVTGNALLSDQTEYLEAGVDKVLTKPVLERSLKEILLFADEKRKRASVSVSSDVQDTTTSTISS